ncbi:MAG: SRPBCC family protein [Bacteroidia bacterium]
MKSHIHKSVTVFNKPLEEVFEFFSKAENLNKVTPEGLSFKILTPLPIKMSKGTLIEYRIKLSGIPFNWKTEILAWEPPFRFIDSQIKGPYKIWIHEHTFEFIDGKTVMTDTVEFLSPGWIFEPIINKVFVEKKVKEIFEYRTKVLNDIFS